MEELLLRSWTTKGRPEAILTRVAEVIKGTHKKYTFRYKRFFYTDGELSDSRELKLVVSPDFKIDSTEKNPMGRYWHTANKNEFQFIKRVHFAEICSMVHFDKNLMNEKVESLN